MRRPHFDPHRLKTGALPSVARRYSTQTLEPAVPSPGPFCTAQKPTPRIPLPRTPQSDAGISIIISGWPPVPYRYPPPSRNLLSGTAARPASRAWYPIATPIAPNPPGATITRGYLNRNPCASSPNAPFMFWKEKIGEGHKRPAAHSRASEGRVGGRVPSVSNSAALQNGPRAKKTRDSSSLRQIRKPHTGLSSSEKRNWRGVKRGLT